MSVPFVLLWDDTGGGYYSMDRIAGIFATVTTQATDLRFQGPRETEQQEQTEVCQASSPDSEQPLLIAAHRSSVRELRIGWKH